MWQDIKNIYHLFNAVLANGLYGFPSRKLTVIGVTGTDGKTTTVNLIYHILQKAGRHASMISSIGAIINGKASDIGFHVTTPSPWSLQKFIKKAKGFLVLEVTSHALDQHRVWGIKFDVGVLTNVTHEHLDYHKTYENYVRTKSRLFGMAKKAVINRDDKSFKAPAFAPSTPLRASAGKQNSKLITYGMSKSADLNPQNFPFETKLLGEFNRYNILAAVGACKALGLSDKEIREGIEGFEAPKGRGEIVYENSFYVMIDFAHTPNALEQILSSVRSEVKGRLIHVFGSAGERDYKKRPLMGKVSSNYADIVILTAEDPRSESIEEISNQIAQGIEDKNKMLMIPNRQEAINKAIKMAKEDDFILITGKAHEKSMNYGHGEEPWNEYEAVEKVIKLMNKR
ncbi:MAG: UDP-N-acetylmuramoyl-L-alanyl-D-glutamate--2,6-diaminopimelate ligase [Candidatus Levyibacteriota bacterium]